MTVEGFGENGRLVMTCVMLIQGSLASKVVFAVTAVM